MKLYNKRSIKLNKKEILNIARLKNSHWNFGISSQLSWFNNKKNVFKNDFHILLKKKQKIIGYVQLGKRKYISNSKEKNYYLFNTLIITKKERNGKLAKKIMNEVSNILKKKKIPSFLICKKELINFYKKYGWVKLNKRKYKIEDHKNHLTGMTFDLKNKDREKILKFYYHV